MHLITKWFGTFLYEKNTLQDHILFPNNEKELKKRLKAIEEQKILAEEKKLTQGHHVIVNEPRLQTLGEYTKTDKFFKTININPETYGFDTKLLQNISTQITKDKVDEQLHAKDLQLVHMVNALDDLIQTANLLSERLSYWSAIPTPKEKRKPLQHTYDTVNTEIKTIEHLIEEDMQHIAPNITTITGPLIGARLIALAGTLQHLAQMPASTIQILGAEKALFRYKKEGGKPPKHGVIFQHPLIKRAPRNQRGKRARLLATKITTAAKADAFTKRDISKELKEAIETRIQEITNK
jgi:nucleolar protein 56